MIVPAMTCGEIYKELVEDGATTMKAMATKMRIQVHVMKRTNNFKWVETLHFKSPKNNDWSVTIRLSREIQEINLYVKTSDEHGISAYNFFMVNDLPFIVKYHPHFFKRYRERMGLKEVKPDQVIKKFFRNNVVLNPAYSEKDDNGVMMAVIQLPEGIGLGRFSEDAAITEMKTFIAHDMLNKGQRKMWEELNDEESGHEKISFIDKG